MHSSNKLYITHSFATSGGCPIIIVAEHLAQYIIIYHIYTRCAFSHTLAQWPAVSLFLCHLQ